MERFEDSSSASGRHFAYSVEPDRVAVMPQIAQATFDTRIHVGLNRDPVPQIGRTFQDARVEACSGDNQFATLLLDLRRTLRLHMNMDAVIASAIRSGRLANNLPPLIHRDQSEPVETPCLVDDVRQIRGV